MKKIIFSPSAVSFSSQGAIEIIAGIELTAGEVSALVETPNIGGPYSPVFLIHNGGHRQKLTPQDLEAVLIEPLAAYRQKLAAEAAEYAAAIERAAKEAQAAQEQKEAAILAAQKAEADAKKLQFQNAIG